MASRQVVVASTHTLLQQLAGEFGSLKRRAQGSAASAYYGMDKEQAAARMMALADRIASMQQVSFHHGSPSRQASAQLDVRQYHLLSSPCLYTAF